jgi:membrane-associated phospholipid phosphatase
MDKKLFIKQLVNRLKERLLPLTAMLSILVIDIFYIVLNNGSREVHSLVTEFDRHTPFLKIFILPYMSWQAFLFLTLAYLCFKDLRTYYRTLITIDLSLLICDMIFLFYQTTVPRPVLVGEDWLTRLIRALYRSDQPYNCFPSIHVLTSYVLLKAIHVSPVRNVWNRWIVSSFAITIILSTLFIKQHVLLDVIGGITIGGLVFTLVDRFEHVQLWIRTVLFDRLAQEPKNRMHEFSNDRYTLVQSKMDEAMEASKKIS